MPIKMNAAQTRRSEVSLAERIEHLKASSSLEGAMLAKARAEGALEGMSEMGYSTLATEAQKERIKKAYAAARKRLRPTAPHRTSRPLGNSAWTLQCLREMVLPEPLIQAMGDVLTAMARARTRDSVRCAQSRATPLLEDLRTRGVIDEGDEAITREIMDSAAERRCAEVFVKELRPGSSRNESVGQQKLLF